MDYLDTKGRIFDVQKYSIHDGPGIRTIVFLKGCVLRCKWCCNPESQEYKIQSMACAKWETIESILPYLDTYLMDIKHTNAEKHKEFTGRSNELMMENARKVALSGLTNLVIRVPVIPTFNDTVEEIQRIAGFADTLPGVNKIHLLPYHRLGQDKYEGLGRTYLMGDIEPPSKEHMETLKKAVHAVSGLDCQIGG